MQLHCESKNVPPNHGRNFANSWSLLRRTLHYLGKLKNQHFALFMYVKHSPKVTFIIYLTDICHMS